MHTKTGGDAVEQNIVTIGQVTYELRRVFQGTQPLTELMAERLTQNILKSEPVDGDDSHAV